MTAAVCIVGRKNAGKTSLIERLLPELERRGTDLIEVGVPFSDPLADGPTIQNASVRALARGTSLAGILGMVRRVRARVSIPLVLFSYYNPIHFMGLAQFARAARRSGVDGVIVPDLPPEEGEALSAALTYAKALAQGPSVAIDLGRRFVHKSLTSTLDEMLDYEAIASVITAATDDAKEGTSSFIEKRKPEFKGQ